MWGLLAPHAQDPCAAAADVNCSIDILSAGKERHKAHLLCLDAVLVLLLVVSDWKNEEMQVYWLKSGFVF